MTTGHSRIFHFITSRTQPKPANIIPQPRLTSRQPHVLFIPSQHTFCTMLSHNPPPRRFPGVLQRIALSSFVNSVQPFRTWFFPIVATAAWWILSIRLYNTEECSPSEGVERWFSPPNCTAQSTIDYVVFEKKHLYTADYDPEGLLSTLTTSAVTVTAGFHTLKFK